MCPGGYPSKRSQLCPLVNFQQGRLESQALQELAPLTSWGKTLSPGECVQNSG